MGLLNHFKKRQSTKVQSAKPEAKPVMEQKVDEPKKPASPVVSRSSKEIKGKSEQAYSVLIKPLVTEKATEFSAAGKYVFVVNPKLNKIEVKKAVRKIYGVDPVQVNISNISGRKVRYGRISGRTKSWKKAIVTLKPGDKIEIYEGV